MTVVIWSPPRFEKKMSACNTFRAEDDVPGAVSACPVIRLSVSPSQSDPDEIKLHAYRNYRHVTTTVFFAPKRIRHDPTRTVRPGVRPTPREILLKYNLSVQVICTATV
jgi:hypothetical protein